MKKYSLSAYQINIWNMEMTVKNTAVSNIGGLVEYSKAIDYDILVKAFEIIVAENAAMRMRLTCDGNCYFSEDCKPIVEKIEANSDFYSLCNEWIRQPFDIIDKPLYTVKLMVDSNKSFIFLNIHHILGDGMAIANICKNLENIYSRLLVESIEPKISGFIPEKNIPEIKYNRGKAYFDSIKNETTVFENSLDYSADIVSYTIEENKLNILKSFAKENRITLQSIFYGGLYIYFSKILSKDKLFFGNVLLNRSFNTLEEISMRANTLPLTIEKSDSFINLCKAVSLDIARLTEFSFYSNEDLYKNQGISRLLYAISLSYKNKSILARLSEGEITELFNGYCDSNLRFFIDEYENKIEIRLVFKTSLYTRKYAKLLIDRLINIIEMGVKDEPLSSISIFTDYDKNIYKSLNNTEYKYNDTDIYNCFRATARANENKIAVVDTDCRLTYKEMLYRVDNMCEYLLSKGVSKGQGIGIKIKRNANLPIIFLALLKLKAVYIPIDYNADNIQLYKDYCAYILSENENGIVLNTCNENSKLYDNTAYILFTSGSTGKPKGVAISEKALINRLYWMNRKYNLSKRILQKTVNTFDVSIWEILSVAFGAELYMLPQGYEKLPDKIAEYIEKNSIQALHFVPSMLEMFLQYCNQNNIVINCVEDIFSSGEKLTATICKEYKSVFTNARLHNLYGPTECAIDVTSYDVTDENCPIGKPVDNTQIFILSQNGELLPPLEKGEICIGGVQLGSYIDNNKGFQQWNGIEIYRSGDIGYVNTDGNIVFIGREDKQRKIRGMRVELSSVENTILSYNGVTDARVFVKNNKIIAVYTGMANKKEILAYISNKLLNHEMPSVLAKIQSIPTNNVGKTDYNRILTLIDNKRKSKEVLTDIEKLCALVIGDEIGKRIGIYDNVFDLGLDSLGVIRVTNSLNSKGINVRFSDFYEYKTISAIISNHREKPILTYLKNNNSNKLLLCVPYGGAEPQVYNGLASLIYDRDVMGVYISEFNRNDTIEKIAEILKKELLNSKYSDIVVLGHCVGCAVALETAYRLEELGKKVEKVVLCASLPVKGISIMGNVISHWDLMNGKMIHSILNKLGKEKVIVDKAVETQFKNDAMRYFVYMEKSHRLKISAPVDLLFSQDDLMTKNYEKLYKKWYDYIDGNINCHTVKTSGHYFIKTNPKEVRDVIFKG